MKLLIATVITLSLHVSVPAQTNKTAAADALDSQLIKITRNGEQPSRQGPAENFDGSAG